MTKHSKHKQSNLRRIEIEPNSNRSSVQNIDTNPAPRASRQLYNITEYNKHSPSGGKSAESAEVEYLENNVRTF